MVFAWNDGMLEYWKNILILLIIFSALHHSIILLFSTGR